MMDDSAVLVTLFASWLICSTVLLLIVMTGAKQHVTCLLQQADLPFTKSITVLYLVCTA